LKEKFLPFYKYLLAYKEIVITDDLPKTIKNMKHISLNEKEIENKLKGIGDINLTTVDELIKVVISYKNTIPLYVNPNKLKTQFFEIVKLIEKIFNKQEIYKHWIEDLLNKIKLKELKFNSINLLYECRDKCSD
jgi:hypothetical protein